MTATAKESRPKEPAPAEAAPVALREDGALVFAGSAYRCRRLPDAPPGGWRCAMAKEGEPGPDRTVEMSPSGVWRCSCDGWRYRKHCRHLRAAGALRALQLVWRGTAEEQAPPARTQLPPGGLLLASLGGDEAAAAKERERIARAAQRERMLRREYRGEADKPVPASPQPPAPAFDSEAFRESILAEAAGMMAQGGKRG